MAISIQGITLKDRNTVETASRNTSAVKATATAAGIAPVATGTSGGGTVTDGRFIDASNTGLNYNGVSESSLTTIAANTTYSTAGQVITGKLFTGGVVVSAANITFRNCKFMTSGSSAMNMHILSSATGTTVEGCLFTAPSGHSAYEGILTDANNTTITRCDISQCENDVTINGSNASIVECYLHDVQKYDNPDGHKDVIEIFSGATINILRCRLTMMADETSVVNIAPWGGNAGVSDVTVADCYLDGGNMIFVVDYQGTAGGDIKRTRVLRNFMSGHQNTYTGHYTALNNADGRAIVNTESAVVASPSAILWPSSGADANHWIDCADLSPDRTGQIVTV